MKPLSVEMACLLGIQNEIQAVWYHIWGWVIPNLRKLYRSTFRNSWGFLRVHLWSVTQFNGGPIGEWGDIFEWSVGARDQNWIQYQQYISHWQPNNCKLFCLSENLTYSLEIIREHIILSLLENSVWGPKWEWGTLGIFFGKRSLVRAREENRIAWKVN